MEYNNPDFDMSEEFSEDFGPDGISDANKTEFDVTECGIRLDITVSEKLNITRSVAQKLICDGAVTVSDMQRDKNYKTKNGDRIRIILPALHPCEAIPQDIPLDIVYEDNSLIVVNKPKGMVVHPAAGNPDGTLVNALLYHCGDSLSGIGGVLRPGIIHRIDKDTSGLLVVAKNDYAHNFISAQLHERKMGRFYETVVIGYPREGSGTVNAPIGRHPVDRKKMAVVPSGREAVTHYEVLKSYDGTARREGYSHLRLALETGRTHQIRVHMAHIGHPVLGDEIYGGTRTFIMPSCAGFLSGQCLHARTLEFIHPESGELMRFESELPEYFVKVLKRLEEIN